MEITHKHEVSPVTHSAIQDPVGHYEAGVAEAVAQLAKAAIAQKTNPIANSGNPPEVPNDRNFLL
jgi:hypothetical protein